MARPRRCAVRLRRRLTTWCRYVGRRRVNGGRKSGLGKRVIVDYWRQVWTRIWDNPEWMANAGTLLVFSFRRRVLHIA